MVAQPLEIHVDPESETGKLLEQAGERPLRLVSGGREYRVEAVPGKGERSMDGQGAERKDPFANSDLERSAAAWRATFGILKGIDIEALKADLKEQRGQDTPGRPGW